MDIPQELVERMVEFVRMCADSSYMKCSAIKEEAESIAALLPEPVDPDMVEARELIARACAWFNEDPAEMVKNIRAGLWDYPDVAQGLVADTYAAIKRGRELASKDTPNHG